MLKHPALDQLRDSILNQRFDWAEGLDIEEVDWETFVDSAEDIGLQVWILLREERSPGVMSMPLVAAAEKDFREVAKKIGLEGPCLLAIAMPDEADLLPSRRDRAAA